MGINVEKRVPSQVRAFCIIEKNSSISFLRVAAEKIKAGGAAEQSKTFIKFSGNKVKIVIFYRDNML